MCLAIIAEIEGLNEALVASKVLPAPLGSLHVAHVIRPVWNHHLNPLIDNKIIQKTTRQIYHITNNYEYVRVVN